MGGQGHSGPVETEERDYWEKVSATWKQAKEIVEEKIYEIDNGPRFAKYARMTRHNYLPIVQALGRDDLLSERAIEHFEIMRQIFNEFRPQAYTVPVAKWTQFERAFNEFKRLAG